MTATAGDDADLDRLLVSLDLPAKVRLLTGAANFTLAGERSIGLRATDVSDGPTGVRGVRFVGGVRASLLPNATLLSASWDPATLREVGELLAEEAQRQRVGVVLGPTINLHRSALGGRLFEAFSEDPLLTGVLAAAYVRGLQDRGTGACLKHWVANEAETERRGVDNVVDEQTLREVYLLPFEIAIAEADPWLVMAAYNDVNGTAATEHDELNNHVLRREWGWDGVLVSDWFATRSTAPAANGGLDLVMPGPEGPWGDALVEAVRSGAVAETVVDEHARRLLRLAARVGSLGPGRALSEGLPEPDSDRRRDQLTRLAAQGMTVLRNDGTLPLATPPAGAAPGRIAVIGRHAVETVALGGGSAVVHPPHVVTISEGLRGRYGDAVRLADGVAVRTRPRAARPAHVTDPGPGTPGVALEVLDAGGAALRAEHLDEAQAVVGIDDDLAAPVALVRLVARVQAGAWRLGVVGAGSWTLRIGEERLEFDLALRTTDVGEAVLRAPGRTVDVLLDHPATVHAELEVTDGGPGQVALVAEPAPRSDEELIAEAVRVAAQADVAVVVVGLTEEQETESLDKSTLRLPGRQDELVAAVAAVAARTVVVLNAATPVLMPWRDDVASVLVAGLPGQEAGHAVAAALAGDIEPAGRLVTSFPTADGAAPAWDVVPTDGSLVYAEGRHLGYRGYAAELCGPPAFWFGEGLGYGRWEYGEVSAVATADGGAEVSVELCNRASRDSLEVVQVYLQPDEAGEPVRLVGWARVAVPAGRTLTAVVCCETRMWRSWDVASHGWRRLADGELLVARGLGDIRARVRADGRNGD